MDIGDVLAAVGGEELGVVVEADVGRAHEVHAVVLDHGDQLAGASVGRVLLHDLPADLVLDLAAEQLGRHRDVGEPGALQHTIRVDQTLQESYKSEVTF